MITTFLISLEQQNAKTSDFANTTANFYIARRQCLVNGTLLHIRPKVDFIHFLYFVFLIIEATLNIAWFVSSRTTSTNLDICKTNIRNPAQNPCQFIFLSSQTSLMLCTKLFLMCCQWKFHLVLTNFQFVAIDSNEDKLFKDRAYFCNIFQFYLLTNIYISLLIMWTAGLIKNLPKSLQLFSLFLGIIFTLTSFFWTFCTEIEIINFCELKLFELAHHYLIQTNEFSPRCDFYFRILTEVFEAEGNYLWPSVFQLKLPSEDSFDRRPVKQIYNLQIKQPRLWLFTHSGEWQWTI